MRQGVPNSAQDLRCAPRLFRIVRGDAHVKSLALPDGGVECAHRFFERRFGVGTMAVEDVHVIEPHALEGLVEAGEQIFARTPFAIRTGPHVPACLCGDDEFVAIGMKILFEQGAEIFFSRAGRRTVVVGEIKMRDAEIKGAAGDGATVFEDGPRRRSCTTSQARFAEV